MKNYPLSDRHLPGPSGRFFSIVLVLILLYIIVPNELSFSGEPLPGLPSIEDGSYNVHPKPWEVVSGDFNNDGRQDLAVDASASSSIGVLIGNGDGTFQSPVYYWAGSVPKSIVTADFDEDGNLDLAAASTDSNLIVVLRGFGDGAFGDSLIFEAGDYPSNIIAGDFDLDGNVDLCTSNAYSSDIGIYLGNGHGNFSPPSYYPIPGGPRSPELGDFDEDGNPDIVVSLRSAIDELGIMFGDGSGAFDRTVIFKTGEYPKESVVRDLNGDGHLDIAVACRIENSVRVILGNGDGTFSTPDSISVGTGPRWLSSEDIDGDGVYDLITTNYYGDDLTVLFGDGTGGFPYRSDFDIGTTPRGLTVGDFDLDEKPDLAIAIFGENRLSIVLDIRDDTTPYLISPPHGSIVNSNPLFRWKEIPGASSYQLVLEDSSDRLVWTKFLQGSFQASYNGQEVLDPGQEYRWSVRERDGDHWNQLSPFFTFEKAAEESLLSAPALRFPQEGENISLPELFSWSSLDGADSYKLSIFDDSTATAVLYENRSAINSMYVPAGMTGMTQLKDYYWQVRGLDTLGYEGEKSDVGRFTLTDLVSPPQIPITVSPVAEDTIRQDSVTFVWLPPDGASHFTVEFSTDSAFSPSSDMTWTVERITDSLYTARLREGSSRIFWRVMAINSAGEGAWSDPVSFEYENPTAALIVSAEILEPLSGTEIELGSSMMPHAAIFGSHSGTVEGEWLLGGAVIDSFSLTMAAGEGLQFDGPVITAQKTGVDTLVLSVTHPEAAVSSPLEFEVVYPSAGEVSGIHLVTAPFALPADSLSQTTVTAYMVDSEGRKVHRDYARLVSFVVIGEGTIVGPAAALTDGGIARINVQSTKTPDPEVLIFAYSIGITGSHTFIMTYEKDLEEYVTRVLAHMDRLKGLPLDYYPENVDTSASGFDLHGVWQFLNDEILGVPVPEPESVESLRRLSLALKCLDMCYYYEHSQTFPEEDEQPVYGAGKLFDYLSCPISSGAVVSNFLAQMTDTILPGIEALPEADKVSNFVVKSTQRIFNGLYLPALELTRDGAWSSLVYSALVSSHREAASLARSDEDPQTLLGTYTPRLDRQLEFLDTYIGNTQNLVDSIAFWAQSNMYSATFEEACESVDEQLNIVRSMSQTVFLEAERVDFEKGFLEGSGELSLLREYMNQGQEKNRLVGNFSRAVDYIYFPEKWSSAGEIMLPAVSRIDELVSSHLPVGTRKAFGLEQGQSSFCSGLALNLLDAGDRERIEESLVLLSDTGMQFESVAGLIVARVSENDSSGVAGVIQELCDISDRFLELMYRMRGTFGSFAPSAAAGTAGYNQLYHDLYYLYFAVISRITFFETSVVDYLLNSEFDYTSLTAVQAGFDAITVVNEIVERYTTSIPMFFDLAAVPALVPLNLTLPDSVGPSRIFRVTTTLVNAGSGDATSISGTLAFEGPFEITSAETVSVASLAPGDSVDLTWVLKADDPGSPDLDRGLFSFSIDLQSPNSLAYPGFFLLKGYNKSFGENHHVVKREPQRDGDVRLQRLPEHYSLHQNSPNPFNPHTSIRFDIPDGEPQRVQLRIYDIRGRLLSTLVDEIKAPGFYTVFWNGKDDRGNNLGTGIYFYNIHAGSYNNVRKMLLHK